MTLCASIPILLVCVFLFLIARLQFQFQFQIARELLKSEADGRLKESLFVYEILSVFTTDYCIYYILLFVFSLYVVNYTSK